MPQKTNAKAQKALAEIIALAKKYRASHKGTAWSECIKQAGVQYRKKHS